MKKLALIQIYQRIEHPCAAAGFLIVPSGAVRALIATLMHPTLALDRDRDLDRHRTELTGVRALSLSRDRGKPVASIALPLARENFVQLVDWIQRGFTDEQQLYGTCLVELGKVECRIANRTRPPSSLPSLNLAYPAPRQGKHLMRH